MLFHDNIEIMAGGRRIGRVSSKQNLVYPVVSPIQDERLIIYDVKHIRIPHMPRESTQFFELILCVHISLFMGLQFLHLYRTVWWLPQSFNHSGINFHLIDGKIIVFVSVVLFRRLPYLILKSVLPRSMHLLLQYFLTINVLIWVGVTTFYFWKDKRSYLQISFLYMPILFYVFVHGFYLRPFWDVDELDNPGSLPCHVCINQAPIIREQVDYLRAEFNSRFRKVICNATTIVYYTTFIPWSFVQTFVFYDLYWVTQHIIISWLLTVSLLMSRAFCPDFSDGLHKVACHLGSWTRLRPNHIPSQLWYSDNLFPPGSIVKHQRELYKAEGNLCVASEPGNPVHERFQLLFSGSSFPRILAGFQTSLVLLILIILLRTGEWYQLISVGTMITTSFYSYIRLSRDYLTLAKIYEAEKIIWAHGT